jgi:hypothetical protein
MIDKLFMQDLAYEIAPPLEPVEQPATLLASGPARSDVGQVTVQGYNEAKPSGVRVGRAGITPEQSAKAGGLDRPLVALLDTLAGALKGATAQTLGLPGDIRSILDLISKEGAQKYLGEPVLPTTEEMQNILPAVVPQGVANQAEREYTAKMASEIGTFLPAPGIPEAAVQGVKAVTKAIKATKGLPVGMSTQAVGEGVDNLGFYSAARQAVDAIQQPKGTGDQFLKQIEKTPGVKPDEIKWTGLDDFLKSKKTVTKAEVQEYLDKNKVEIKEIQMGGGKSEYPHRTADEWQGAIDKAEKAKNWDEAEKLTMAWEEFELGGKTKFAKYTLPGGENYREILLTLPGNKARADNLDDAFKLWMADAKAGKRGQYSADELAAITVDDVQDILKEEYLTPSTKGEFRSQHFDQPNILAHLRVNDRVIDGKKTLFIEEVQSDWHQAGRKKGYSSDIGKQLEAINAERTTLMDEKLRYEKLAEPYVNEGKDAPQDIVEGWTLASNRLQSLQMKQDRLSTGVPDAPFKTTWSELSMKRAIQMASEGGYDRIAFTTGKTQADRYDLSKQVKMISAMPSEGGKYNIYIEGKDGDALFRNQNGFGEYGQKNVTPQEFEELVGKDAASTIMQKTDELNRGKVSKDQYKFYDSKPADLTIGGEGMKGFYDDILPKFLNKYSKKWDAKVGKTEIEVGKGKPTSYADFDEYSKAPASSKVEVSYIDITPKMRESTLTKGQPMFAIGAGGAGAAATQQEDNK